MDKLINYTENPIQLKTFSYNSYGEGIEDEINRWLIMNNVEIVRIIHNDYVYGGNYASREIEKAYIYYRRIPDNGNKQRI